MEYMVWEPPSLVGAMSIPQPTSLVPRYNPSPVYLYLSTKVVDSCADPSVPVR